MVKQIIVNDKNASVHTLTVAAKILGLSSSYLRLLAWSGELDGAYKSGHVWLVHVPTAADYLRNRVDRRYSK